MLISENYTGFFLSFILSLIVTFTTVSWLIPQLKSKGFVGRDMNKPERHEIPEMGGIGVVIGFFAGIYIQIIIFDVFGFGQSITEFLMASSVVLMGLAFIGLLDDLLGMRQRTKAFLPFLFALPLGVFVPEEMYIPLFGNIDFGYLMLFLVPFAITCAANSTNMLEGFNGLGSGMAIIISLTLIIIAVINDDLGGVFFLSPLLGSLLAFFYFNKYPAKIFPGDTLTLFMGGTIACSAIISDLKLEGAILLLPMIFEFFLKAKGKFKAQCFGQSLEKGILYYEGPIESLTHFVMINFRVTEVRLVTFFLLFEASIGLILIIFSYNNLI